MKKCRLCGIEKPEDDFYKHPKMIGGRDSKCKECTKAAVRANYRLNIEHYKAYERSRANLPHRVKARADYAASDAGREAQGNAKKRWQQRNPVRRAAHVILGNAVRDGRLVKPDSCERCGRKDSMIHGHHDDYGKPLDVEWLCPKCHSDAHK